MEEISKLTATKEHTRKIESENVTLADENDELRQFSIDGFNIAKSISSITVDRENLTSDLADKAEQIKMLLKRKGQLEKLLEDQLEENRENQRMMRRR